MGPFRLYLAAGTLALLIGACARTSDEAGSGDEVRSLPATDRKSSSPALGEVNDSLKRGAFDDAAARLLELQSSGRSFTPKEAADYRKAMNEAYSRALEAAEKGDQRAEEAIRMIRAANPH